ncbi:MAG: hypothetical protein U9R56_02360 [candidate division Zixibacteria bacterium]|nr:hypothetical protein [candidate division Zixibacteria bacterium]
MLNPSEKSYYQALLALKKKDYSLASDQFDKAMKSFRDDKEFNLLRETTRLLVAVKKELEELENEDAIQIEEVFSNG